jgi:hypothetical protein
MRADRPSIHIDETRLLVIEVRKGSIVLELLPALAPIVATVEYANTVIDFVKHMASGLDKLRQPKGRLEDPTTQQLKNMGEVVQSVAKDSNGSLTIAAKYSNGDVVQEYVVRQTDARNISQNASAQLKEISDKGSHAMYKVLMHLHQSSVEDLKVGKRTSEKGIVEAVDMTPRALIYASDLAGQQIKEVILEPGGNPYQKAFVIDMDVETVNGRPRAYRVLEVHQVLDLDEDEA